MNVMAKLKPPERIFVGREDQLGRLKESLQSVADNGGRMVMLIGEPGIGKTRTAQELTSYAEEQGIKSLWGRCYEGQQMPPYWPWVQAINTYIRSCERDRLQEELGGKTSILSEVFEELKEVFPDLQPPPKTIDPESGRFRLFDALTVFLKRISRSQPMIIVLDDLHWSDSPSLVYLSFLARELTDSRLLVVGTYRDVEINRRHPLLQTLADLTRDQLFDRILLRRLNKEDVTTFLELSLAGDNTKKLANEIFTVTEGNPLFISEVIRFLDEQGGISEDQPSESGFAIKIPEGIREVIGKRLNRLPPSADDMLAIGAVIGREFSLSLLRELVDDDSKSEILTLLEEAIAAGIIEEDPNEIGRYQFSHSMIMETLVNELSLTHRVQLHARIAETLERLYGADAVVHAAEIAGHLIQAEAILGTEKMVHYCLKAGEQALSAHAYEDAQSFFQKGLDAKEKLPMDRETADLSFGLGKALVAMGKVDTTQEVFTRAFDYYLDSNHVSAAVDVASHPVDLWAIKTWQASLGRRVFPLINDRSYDWARLVEVVYRPATHDYGTIVAKLHDALAIARENEDFVLEIKLLGYWNFLDRTGDHLHTSTKKRMKYMIGVARKVGDLRLEGGVNWQAANIALELGNIEEAEYHIAQSQIAIEHMPKNLSSIYSVDDLRARVAFLTGDWERFHDYYQQAMQRLRNRLMRYYVMLYRIQIAFERGKDQGQVLLNQFVNSLDDVRDQSEVDGAKKFVSEVIPAIVRISDHCKYIDMAVTISEDRLAAKGTFGRQPTQNERARTTLALLSLFRGNLAKAEVYYSEITSFRKALPFATCSMTSHRALGYIAGKIGRTDEAIEHFEKGYQFCKKAGYLPELAWTCHDYAEVLLQREDDAAREKADAILAEGESISGKLGMKPLHGKIESLQNQPRLPSKLNAPCGLTKREVEVLKLLAVGKTNNEIADTLFISDKTVATHVSNIFGKTGAGNRTEAAAFAGKYRLTAD